MSTFAGRPHPYSMPRATVHSFLRFPPSPSETDLDFDMNSGAGQFLGGTPEHPRRQSRRTSTLSYQNTGHRDLRDRSYSRSSRNLVVVIPPSDLPLGHGQLGNVLSTGPRHRLSQGILMPLFPSMFAQLNAIAREYNFPSTVGLCLYLHINENGITMTPRISDDSWQYLFGHLFNGRSPSGGQELPIGGNIEFDIDLNKARWFDAWISGTLRDSDPAFPQVGASRPPLEAHWRGESRTINADEQPVEDRWNTSGSQTLVTNLRPETLRHLPKKLSLVDKLELHPVHVAPKAQDHPDLSESSPTHGTYASSPILQSAIPEVTESDLERRVNSWRASTELYPVSMAEAYQPTPDVGVSARATIMDEYALERNFRQGVRIDEFIWSVTSAGPLSPAMESSIVSSRPSSIHLDRRVNGTVPLTATTMTSWGPTDDEFHSILSSVTRLPSPDTGERVIEDIMAPRSSAVWGNSFGWRFAMTWKQVYPYSLIQAKPIIRVHLQGSNGPVPQYPNLVIYPSVGSQPDTQSPLNISERLGSSPHSVWGSSFGWQRTVTWRKPYPYSMATMRLVSPVQLRGAGGLAPKYPNICIYPAIYPYSEVYPACTVEEDVSQPVHVMLNKPDSSLTSYPNLVIYPAVYPRLDIYPPVVGGVKTKVDTNIYSLGGMAISYPNLVIYPAVYPHFDLYPKVQEISEIIQQKEVDVKLVNAGCLMAEYPNMTIYPGAYPYLELYPTQHTRKQGSDIVWGISFGWLTAKTWLQVYPLHGASPLTTSRRVDDQSGSISKSGSDSARIADIVVRRQPVWGSSFGWGRATTWRAVWPTHARTHPNVNPISVQLGQQRNYPFPMHASAYPHFDIYPRAAIAKAGESQQAQTTVNLIPHYPNLVIYPAAYPHFDLYPVLAKAVVTLEHGKGDPNLRRRRIEMWRTKTAAQVGLSELLANNHVWEVEEPLQLDLTDYAWSRTSVGPDTSPLELLDTPTVPGSVHLDRRVQGSVLRTPSTATTWGPQDDDWYSEIGNIECLPSPDLGQRVLDDVENIEFPHQPWHIVWPFFVSQVNTLPSILEQSVFVPEYPHLVIYPPVYPHFELYPAWANVPPFEDEITKALAKLNSYPALDISPAVCPHIDIHPVVDLRTEVPSKIVLNVQHEQVEVKLASLYPNFDIYHACYPYNLDYIYPFVKAAESAQIPVEASHGYPWLVIYPLVYPFIIPYPCFPAEINQPREPEQRLSIFSSIERKLVDVKLPAPYPLLEIYPAGYPWSLESIYPAVSIDDCSTVVKPQYPCIWIYPPVYPFVQPYPSISNSIHVPGTLDEGAYESVKASLALSELEPIDAESVVYPYFDLYPIPSIPAPQQGRAEQDAYVDDLTTPPARTHSTRRRQRKTHAELHASVSRSLGKKPARIPKTHLQLHTEVFQDSAVWTPSGYVQDLSSLMTRKRGDTPVLELQLRQPSQDTPRPSRSRSGTTITQSSDKVVFPRGQPPPLPPLSPLRVRSPTIPSQPSPAVSESPVPRMPSTNTHVRAKSARLSEAVRAILPGGQKRSASARPMSPPSEDHRERAKSPTRFLSLVDRRPPPLPQGNTSEFLTRPPRNPTAKESLVLQRARAYEQATAMNQSPGNVDVQGTHSPFLLPPLPSMPFMAEVSEAFEKSKITLL